ncbi:MAG: ankyrin repeat domain-containing protein [Armatimonadetes bacterium]|nr:ankyrin repeat domain-containing protein [Akkermansiaceae bacterium]
MLTLYLPLYGSEIDAGGLLEAASKGDLERVRELLTKNPDLLNGTGNGGTPLCAATILARKEVIELLLSKGADVNLPTHQYFVPKGDDNQMPKPLSVTPLQLAAYQGYAEIAKILLAAKANPTAKSEDGTTPLHTAAVCGRAEVVKVLIDGKADLNARDKDEATPVHYAAALGRPEIYDALVAAGADVDAVAQKGSYAGKTPRQMAKEHFQPVLPDPALAKSVISMRILVLALHEFAKKHGTFPNEVTAKILEKTSPESVKIDPSSSDDFLNQAALVYSEPASLSACMTGDGADKRWVCSYIPGAAPTSDSKRPVALLPLIQGKPLFEAAALSGKAVIVFADFSVLHFPIEPDGRVLINGLDIFDSKQPFWEGSKPNIKWPRPAGSLKE